MLPLATEETLNHSIAIEHDLHSLVSRPAAAWVTKGEVAG